MKRVLFSILTILLVVSVVQAKKLTIPLGSGRANSSISGTYANSQVDTITIIREPGVTAMSLSVTTSDSAQFGTTVGGTIYRKIDDNLITAVAADSLYYASNWATTSNTGASYAGNIVISSATLALPSYYVVYLKYAAAGNGVSTPTVVYKVQKNYAYKP
jgi:hypothetical protein